MTKLFLIVIGNCFIQASEDGDTSEVRKRPEVLSEETPVRRISIGNRTVGVLFVSIRLGAVEP